MMNNLLNLPLANAQAQGGGFEIIIMMVAFFAIMYFMIIRPQQKRAKEHQSLIESISKGDEISTAGGIVGKVVQAGDNFVEISVNDSSTLIIQKHAVSALLPKGTMKELK